MTISVTTIATTVSGTNFSPSLLSVTVAKSELRKKKKDFIWLRLLDSQYITEESQGIKLNHCRNLKTGAKDYHRTMLLTSLFLRACSCFRSPAQGVPPLKP